MAKETTGPYFKRSLENYKTMHEKTAKDREVYERFMSASTLTAARKILFGVKTKKPTHLGRMGIGK